MGTIGGAAAGAEAEADAVEPTAGVADGGASGGGGRGAGSSWMAAEQPCSEEMAQTARDRTSLAGARPSFAAALDGVTRIATSIASASPSRKTPGVVRDVRCRGVEWNHAAIADHAAATAKGRALAATLPQSD